MNGSTISLSTDGSATILPENETLLQTFENLVATNGDSRRDGTLPPRGSTISGGKKRTAKGGGGSGGVVESPIVGGDGGKKRRRTNDDTSATSPPSKKQAAIAATVKNESTDCGVSRKKPRKSAVSTIAPEESSIRLMGDAIGAPITFHDLVQMCNVCETVLSREERKIMGTQLPAILRQAELDACTGNTKHRQIREICRTLMYCCGVNPDLARRNMLRRFERYGVCGVPASLLTDKLMVRNIDMWMEYSSNDCCEWHDNGMMTEHVQWSESGHNARLVGRPCRSCAHAFVRVTRHGGALWTECKSLNAALAAATVVDGSVAKSSSVKKELDDSTTPRPGANMPLIPTDDDDIAAADWFPPQRRSMTSPPAVPAMPVARKTIKQDSPDSPMSYEDDGDDGVSSGSDDEDDISSDDEVAGEEVVVGSAAKK